MSWLVKAKDSTAAKNYDQSLGFLEKALADNPKSHKAYIERSIVYQRLGKFQQSLESAEKAIAWAYSNGNRESLAEGQLRRVPADASHSLQLAIKYGSLDKSIDIWKSKVKTALDNAPSGDSIAIDDIPKITDKQDGDNVSDSDSDSDSEVEKSTSSKGKASVPSIKTSPTVVKKPQASFEKNWDKLALDLDSDDEQNSAEKASDPMDFFRALYDKADPDTQRAMMKSYIESNGTALSTNWENVQQGKVETSPPDGMQPKKW